MNDPDRFARAAHYAYHKATKDWVMIPAWDSESTLKDGWRAAAQAAIEMYNEGEVP